MSPEALIAVTERGGAMGWFAAGACVFATALGGARWLRVAQREHYLPDSASRFALRWWGATPANIAGAVVGFAGLVLASRWPAAAIASAVVVAFGPLGLGLKGRTSPLHWTRRLRTLACVWALLQGMVASAGFLTGLATVFCCAGALAVPALVDMSCVVTGPLERKLADKYVRRAADRLRRVKPRVVAITGSYGKTSTKGYVAHLLSASMSVVASPASFNNRAGLARAVNEHLVEGTEVFVAEMGTYARGEIAELCSWAVPDVAVITAIGPVHLERFKSEEKIVEAKSEIFERARCCVVAVDDERLAAVAEACEAQGKRVWRVTGTAWGTPSGAASEAASGTASGMAFGTVPEPGVDVSVGEAPEGLEVRVRGELIAGPVAVAARPGNVACAVAVALELGVPTTEIAKRLGSLPLAPHRLEAQKSPGGFVVLDDTYNANPAGARTALEALIAVAGGGRRRVVVTPGMVELGTRQREENECFAARVAEVAADLVVVGRTNRRALCGGFGSADTLVLVENREQAVAWVRDHLGPGDAVLYENDVPDHYP